MPVGAAGVRLGGLFGSTYLQVAGATTFPGSGIFTWSALSSEGRQGCRRGWRTSGRAAGETCGQGGVHAPASESDIGGFGARWCRQCGWRSAEARSGRGLQYPFERQVRRAATVMQVPRSLIPIEHGSEARIGALEQLAPFFAAARAQNLGKPLLLPGPAGPVGLTVEQRIVEAGASAQLGIEPRLERADGDVLAIGARVGVVIRCGAVEQVVAAPVVPLPRGLHAVNHGRQQ